MIDYCVEIDNKRVQDKIDGFPIIPQTTVPNLLKTDLVHSCLNRCSVCEAIQQQLVAIRRVHLIMKYPLRAAKRLDTKREHNQLPLPGNQIPFLLPQQ